MKPPDYKGHSINIFLGNMLSYSDLCGGFDLFIMNQFIDFKNQENLTKTIQLQGDLINTLTKEMNKFKDKLQSSESSKKYHKKNIKIQLDEGGIKRLF